MRRKPAGIEISERMSGMQRHTSTAERDFRSNQTEVVTDRDGLVRALLAGSVPVLGPPGLPALFSEDQRRALPLLLPGETAPPQDAEARARRHRCGQSLLLAPRLTALLRLLRSEVLQGA